MAKEGYVNLLLAQHKNSKQPGDNKQMVNGRRAFLEQGHYQPLADAISEIFKRHLTTLADQTEVSFFDAGCGEGYYMDQVSQSSNQVDIKIGFSGLDISKFAVQKAAKKYPKNHFAVASTFQLPLENNSQDTVLQIFAPSSELEIHRVLKSTGIWITVNPAANHLYEFKQALYDNPTEHKAEQLTPDGFSLAEQLNVSFVMQLTEPDQRENLLMMTPYYWSATAEKKQKLVDNLQQFTTDFDVCVYNKQ
ncbi:23S rRNA (guanine745-N1)-methyltransferase [Paraglaciecola arctica BSs20135]|uniref:23S rRNA (Guanine745-N1)-methyltransferase n=1 Tax=Paraglaciecola arctica BSs20135 TaxID=493475 RepID=K6YZH7_9ALTE|nr:23S rRNA (guanine745-N1)-methyltransferase [Paraglaciecola arctica BSs20135]